MAPLDDLLQPIVPSLYLLPAENGGRFPQSHCFVVRGQVEALIDAGCGPRRLAAALSGWRPERAIVSHSHPDHCAGLWLLSGTRITSPAQHADRFWRFADQKPRFVEEGEVGERWEEFVRSSMDMREVRADDHFDDGDRIDLGDVVFRAVRTPGHVDDHYVFFEETRGVALTFDIDLTSYGPWYAHRESGIGPFLESIERLIALRPRVVVTSHKGIVTEDIEPRLRAYAAVVDRRDERLLGMLDLPRTLEELTDESPFYGGRPYAEVVLRYWERNMIAKHLERMVTHGRVAREGDRWRRV